jgi:outer membrane protein
MMKKLVVLTALLVLPWQHLAAQTANEAWTLERCIQHALKNNLNVRQAAAQLNNAEADLMQARMNHVPTLNANTNLAINNGRVIDPFTNTFDNRTIESNQLGAQAAMPIFSGMQIYNNVRAQKLAFMASQQDLEVTRNNVALSVANLYLQALLAQQLLEVADNQAEITRSQVDRTERLVNAGALSLDNLLNIKAQLGNEEVNVINARNNYINGLVNLALLLQLPNPEQFSIVKISRLDPGIQLDASIPGVYSSAEATQPQIRAAELRSQQAKYSLAAARGARSPRLSAFANMSTVYASTNQRITNPLNPSLVGETPIGYIQGDITQVVVRPNLQFETEVVPRFDQFNSNFGYGIGFSLTIPILNNWQVNTQIRRAKNALELADLQFETTKNQLFTDVARAVTDYKAAWTRLQANDRNIAAQRESFKFSEARFNQGLLNAVDYLNAKNRLQIAEANLLQAQYELLFRAKILDFYLGKPIILE